MCIEINKITQLSICAHTNYLAGIKTSLSTSPARFWIFDTQKKKF